MIQAEISGEKKQISEGTTVSQLLEQEDVEMPDYVSVSINEEFVKKDKFDTTEIKEGDVVEFLYFMGGGTGVFSRNHRQREQSRHAGRPE